MENNMELIQELCEVYRKIYDIFEHCSNEEILSPIKFPHEQRLTAVREEVKILNRRSQKNKSSQR